MSLADGLRHEAIQFRDRAMRSDESFEGVELCRAVDWVGVSSDGISNTLCAEQFHKEASHPSGLNNSYARPFFVAVRTGFCKSEIWPPDEMFRVALPPNSGSADSATHTCPIIRNQVVAIGVEVIIMKFHLIRRSERQNRTAKSCRPDSEVGFVSGRTHRFLIDHDAVVKKSIPPKHPGVNG
jgi:hypothetical protein